MSEMTTLVTPNYWIPGVELVTVIGTSGETYKSKKFKVVTGVIAQLKATSATSLAVASWGTDNTVTVTCSPSGTSQVVVLEIYGSKS